MGKRAPRAAAVALATLLVCVGGGVAWAVWVVEGAAAGPAGQVIAWTVPTTATVCTDTDGELFETAAVTWPETTAPHALDYTATINDVAVSITDNGTTRSV
ncbi:hypothetical protein [Promicromonospora panici]|uniref:hypothetical protein n=1 Tax=Promicromonospora panici TaxID=2219658 RepID=UPI00101DCD4F|nr:hypothetical protein [Promicromonospora panici]